jgi:hypothetical protein
VSPLDATAQVRAFCNPSCPPAGLLSPESYPPTPGGISELRTALEQLYRAVFRALSDDKLKDMCALFDRSNKGQPCSDDDIRPFASDTAWLQDEFSVKASYTYAFVYTLLCVRSMIPEHMK